MPSTKIQKGNTMTEATENAATEANANELIFKLDDADLNASVDVAKVPAATRRELLDAAIKRLVNGRAHSAKMRFDKAFKEYTDNCEKDPTFSGDKPAEPDYAGIAEAAITDLYAGKVRQRGKGGEKKAAEAKDPVDAVVTQAVVRELFSKRRAKDSKVKYQDITKEVGASGIAYLNAKAATLANGDEKVLAEKLKSIEAKYLKPARAMVGVNAKGEATSDDELL